MLVTRIANLVARVFREANFNDRRRTLSSHLHAIGIVRVQQDHPLGGDDVKQPAKAGLDLLEVAINVGVIELDIVYDHQFGKIVQNLDRLSKKAVSYSSPSIMKYFQSLRRHPGRGSPECLRSDSSAPGLRFRKSRPAVRSRSSSRGCPSRPSCGDHEERTP